MFSYISLLRGINVSGKNKLPMADLKQLYEAIGATHVHTYIQSGNVLFRAASSSTTLATRISQAIQDQWGYTVPVLVRDITFFEEMVAKNPFKECDSTSLHVTLLHDTAHQELLADMAGKSWGDDTFVIRDGVVYIHCPQGYGRTQLNNGFFETKGKTWATTRNWKTINKLVALAKSIPSAS